MKERSGALWHGPVEEEGFNVWWNFHETVKNKDIRVARHMGVDGRSKGEEAPDLTFDDLASFIAAQQAYLARRRGETVPAGATWSHARFLRTEGVIFDLTTCTGVVALSPDNFSSKVSERLCLVAGGTRLTSLALWLERHGQTLRTHGSHGAQTIAGALATGTHGARLGRRSVEEHVLALLIVTGPGSVAWVIPRGGHRLNADLLRRLSPDATVYEDDDDFAAALVHLGGLGIISAVLLRSEPGFCVEIVRQVVPLWNGWEEQWKNGDFKAIGVAVERHVQRFLPDWRPPGPLDHCEVNVHPRHVPDGNGCFQLRYRLPVCPPGLVDVGPQPAAVDLLAQGILETIGRAPPRLIDRATILNLPRIFERVSRREAMPTPEGKRLVGRPGAMLPHVYETERKMLQIWSSAVAVAHADVPVVLELLRSIGRSHLFNDFVACLRPVERSRALLGFTRFENSTVIDIDGIGEALAGDTVERTGREFREQLDAYRIEYSMHWGKLANPNASKVKADYATGVGTWLASRSKLLDAAGRLVFTSPYLRELGLTDVP